MRHHRHFPVRWHHKKHRDWNDNNDNNNGGWWKRRHHRRRHHHRHDG
jgi:hypothetical protein